MGISPSGKSDCGERVTGGGDLRLLPQEYSRTFHCVQAHCGPVSIGGEASGVTIVQAMVEAGSLGIGGD